MNNLKQTIKNNICKKSHIAFFGSENNHELDLFWLSDGKPIEITKSILEVKNFTKNITKKNYRIILKHEQRHLYPNEKLLHLLFYPSLDHLIEIEPPSLVCNIFIEATSISRDLKPLKNLSEKYIESQENQIRTEFNRQIINYDQIAIHTYLYTLSEPKEAKLEEALKNILYIYRHFSFEMLKHINKEQITSGSWNVNNILRKLESSEFTKSFLYHYIDLLELRNKKPNILLTEKYLEYYFQQRDTFCKEYLDD